MIRKLKSDDNLSKVAELIYDTDEFLFPFIFGNNPGAIQKIINLIRLKNNTFNKDCILAKISKDHTISGIINYFNPKEVDHKLEDEDYHQVFGKFELMVLFFKNLFLTKFNNKSKIDGIYIQIVSVSSDFRGQGIGTSLVSQVITESKNNGYKSVWLDVDIKNHKALKLYKKLGFKTINKIIPVPLTNLGVYRMRKEV